MSGSCERMNQQINRIINHRTGTIKGPVWVMRIRDKDIATFDWVDGDIWRTGGVEG